MTGDGWGRLINSLDFGRRVVGKEGNSEARLSQADHTTGREFRGLHLFRGPNYFRILKAQVTLNNGVWTSG